MLTIAVYQTISSYALAFNSQGFEDIRIPQTIKIKSLITQIKKKESLK